MKKINISIIKRSKNWTIHQHYFAKHGLLIEYKKESIMVFWSIQSTCISEMKMPKGIHVVTDALVKTLSVFSPTFLEKQRNIDYIY